MDLACYGGLSIRCNHFRPQRAGNKGEGANREKKAPRSKMQDPEKIQDPRSIMARFGNAFGTVNSMRWNITKSFFKHVFWDLDFEIFLGFGIWDLDLLWILNVGCWMFAATHHTNTSLITSPCTSVNRRSVPL